MKKIDWPGCRVIRYGENYKDNEEEFKKWLEIRRGFIGGSDAGSFNPESRYHSLFSLYMNKVEGVSGFSGNGATERGSLIEEFIRKYTERALGVKIHTCPYALVSERFPFMGANLDGVITDEFKYKGHGFIGKTGVEIKSSRDGFGFSDSPEREEIPDDYYYQIQHQMAVSGIDRFLLPVYVMSSDKLMIFIVERNPEFIEQLIAEESRFWNEHVLAKVPPAPKLIDAEKSIINAAMPGGEYEIELDEDLYDLIRSYTASQKAEKEASEKKEKIGLMIRDYIYRNVDSSGSESESTKVTLAKNDKGVSLSFSAGESSRVDTGKLKGKYPDVYSECLSTNKTSRLTVGIKEVF